VRSSVDEGAWWRSLVALIAREASRRRIALLSRGTVERPDFQSEPDLPSQPDSLPDALNPQMDLPRSATIGDIRRHPSNSLLRANVSLYGHTGGLTLPPPGRSPCSRKAAPAPPGPEEPRPEQWRKDRFQNTRSIELWCFAFEW
jgi:hypothetical protein